MSLLEEYQETDRPKFSFRDQEMAKRADRSERGDLEVDLFVRIVSVIDSTRLVYDRQSTSTSNVTGLVDEYKSKSEQRVRSEFARCLSALGSIKLMWPLPQPPFDAKTLKHIKDVFRDFDRVEWGSNPKDIGVLRHYRFAFDAIVDVAIV